MFFSEESLLIYVLKTGPVSVVLVSSPTAETWAIRRSRRGLQNKNR